MADVHIRELSQIVDGKGKASLIFHMPVDSPYSGVVPTPVSVIDSELDQTEKDALAAGSRVEEPANIIVYESEGPPDVKPRIKLAWQSRYTAFNADYAFRYKYFGATIADASS